MWAHYRCKKYPSMELRGLFQYLINQLKKGSGTELVLLEVHFSLKFPVMVTSEFFFFCSIIIATPIGVDCWVSEPAGIKEC